MFDYEGPSGYVPKKNSFHKEVAYDLKKQAVMCMMRHDDHMRLLALHASRIKPGDEIKFIDQTLYTPSDYKEFVRSGTVEKVRFVLEPTDFYLEYLIKFQHKGQTHFLARSETELENEMRWATTGPTDEEIQSYEEACDED